MAQAKGNKIHSLTDRMKKFRGAIQAYNFKITRSVMIHQEHW